MSGWRRVPDGAVVVIDEVQPHLVDANVRALVGWQIHLRDLGLLGRRWLEFDECCWPISVVDHQRSGCAPAGC
jgi:hypothetical protein